MTAKESVLFIRPVPRELKQKFKAHCAAAGKSMTEVVMDFMRRAVAKETKGKP